MDARLLMYAAGLDDGRATPQQQSKQSATAGTAAAAGNGDSRQSCGAAHAQAGDASASPTAMHAGGNEAEGSRSTQRGNGQQPPAAAAPAEASAASMPQRQPAGGGDATDRVCPHCGHDSTGDGLVASAVRGLSRVGSHALLSRAGSAQPPPAAEVLPFAVPSRCWPCCLLPTRRWSSCALRSQKALCMPAISGA